MDSTIMDELKINFMKTYILPMCWIFMIPIFSYWFFGYATEARNEQIKNVVNSIEVTATMTKVEKAQFIDFFSHVKSSDICNSKMVEYQAIKNSLGELCDDFDYFKIGTEISFYSIIISVSLIICTLCLFLLSFKSQAIQYITFVLAWNISKIFCITQVLIQGGLLLADFYFGTIIIWQTYYPQILFFIGMPVAIACVQMVMVLVKKLDTPNWIDGKLLTHNDSPLLYAELSRICEKFGTDLPNNIVLGIEDNFFVTENKLLLNNEEVLTGKTLYASIFHLKKLDKQEASAIFAHEMAHFSGEDTFFSKKTMPMLAKCDECFVILNTNFITMPASYFLIFFRSVFEISFGKISRMREYRADAMAADYIGAKALANGLVKFVFYSEYRANIEDTLRLKSDRVEAVNFLQKIEEGVHNFASSYSFDGDVLAHEILHPFDTHPPIYKRIEAVGYKLNVEDLRTDVLTNEENSWYHEINNASLIEADLMKNFESEFLAEHEENLVYQFLPSGIEETELVEKYFPAISIDSKDKKETLLFNCKSFRYSKWEREVTYDEVESYIIKKPLFRKKRISFKLKKNANYPNESRKLFFPVKRFSISEEEVFDTFFTYYMRSTLAIESQRIKAEYETNDTL
ncbi:M48 family metallopeptidase [Pseudocolwellia sp. HL-MZ19]|uniref:M48 family metallopeptidase n=1 Tax=Pseudocolwellia sp. HL-MZ19 TaxID=3400846 RepID=UPI003CF1C9D7